MPADLGLGIHEEWQFAEDAVPSENNISGLIKCHPVHFPRTKQFFAQGSHPGVGKRQVLVQRQLTHIGGIDGHPAQASKIKLRAAMLRRGDIP